MKPHWTPKNVTIAGSLLISALLILPNLGKGLALAAHLINTPGVAYAAKTTAETVQNEFHDYLTEQRAYTKAISEATQQLQRQQIQQSAPTLRHFEEQDDAGRWCCDAGTYQACWEPVNQWVRCPEE